MGAWLQDEKVLELLKIHSKKKLGLFVGGFLFVFFFCSCRLLGCCFFFFLRGGGGLGFRGFRVFLFHFLGVVLGCVLILFGVFGLFRV